MIHGLDDGIDICNSHDCMYTSLVCIHCIHACITCMWENMHILRIFLKRSVVDMNVLEVFLSYGVLLQLHLQPTLFDQVIFTCKKYILVSRFIG